MRLHLSTAAVTLTFALAGCATSAGLAPHATPTAAATLPTTRSLAGVTTGAWPAADWWTALGDTQLSTLIDEALADNPSLAAADARARAAQAIVGAAKAERLPTFGVGASVSEARIPTTVPGLGTGHMAAARYGYGSFKWDIDLWGGKRAAWEAAVGQAQAAEVDARAARVLLSTNVARAYVQLAHAFTEHDLAVAERDRADAVRKLTAQRVAAGLDNRMQLRRSDAEVASAQQQVAVAARMIDAARSALSVLLGQGPDRGQAITRPQPLQPGTLAVPDDLTVGLIAHRADLVAARWRVAAAQHDIKAAKTQFLPNLSLGVLAGVIAVGDHSVFQLPARFYSIAPAVSLPIFEGGRLRANLAGKDAQYDLAVAHYNQTLVAAVNEVADDVNALQSLATQITAQTQALDAARDAWQLADQRFKAGIGSWLEALSVRQQLLAAEQRMAQLAEQRNEASVQLIQALGGGWKPAAAAPAAPTFSAAPRS